MLERFGANKVFIGLGGIAMVVDNIRGDTGGFRFRFRIRIRIRIRFGMRSELGGEDRIGRNCWQERGVVRGSKGRVGRLFKWSFGRDQVWGEVVWRMVILKGRAGWSGRVVVRGLEWGGKGLFVWVGSGRWRARAVGDFGKVSGAMITSGLEGCRWWGRGVGLGRG